MLLKKNLSNSISLEFFEKLEINDFSFLKLYSFYDFPSESKNEVINVLLSYLEYNIVSTELFIDITNILNRNITKKTLNNYLSFLNKNTNQQLFLKTLYLGLLSYKNKVFSQHDILSDMSFLNNLTKSLVSKRYNSTELFTLNKRNINLLIDILSTIDKPKNNTFLL